MRSNSRAQKFYVHAGTDCVLKSVEAVIERLEPRRLLSAGGLNRQGTERSTRAVSVPGYQIDMDFAENTLTAGQKAAFTAAATRWQSVLLGDLPDGTFDFNGDGVDETIDDIRITARAAVIDGPGGSVIGVAPGFGRSDTSFLPITGQIIVDSADVGALEADGRLGVTILRAMGNSLGLGVLWDVGNHALISNAGTSDPRYLGTLANAQYQAIFGLGQQATIPLENTGAAHDRFWREATFDTELMTGTLDAGVANPLSLMTIAQFADIGYPSVNLNAFDLYVKPAGGTAGNAYPTIASLTSSTTTMLANSNFTLTANGAGDANGTVAKVKFYRETNGVPGLQVLVGAAGDIPGDQLLATDDVPANGYSANVSTTGLGPGSYTYYAQATDNQGLIGVSVSTSNSVVTPGSPTLQEIRINDGSAQRSQVTSITLRFNKGTSLMANALLLGRLNSGGSGANNNTPPSDATSALAEPTTSDGGVTWTYSFVSTSPFVQSAASGSLVDGIYVAGVDPSKVSSAGSFMVNGGTLTFHRLFADVTGNKTTNTQDYGLFRNAFGRTSGQPGFDAKFDFDNNGIINTSDYGQFRNRFGKVFTY